MPCMVAEDSKMTEALRLFSTKKLAEFVARLPCWRW